MRNKRRPDRPATDPTDYDLVNACEQWLADVSAADSRIETFAQPVQSPEARDAVRTLLSKSAAFAQLSHARRARLARDMVQIADYLVPRERVAAFATLVNEVNFPRFVADLIEGVFNAIVDASISQMEAYADLLASVAVSLDQFRDGNVTDIQLRDRLCEQFPALCQPAGAGDDALIRRLDTLAGGTWRRMATSRQQLLATMVMMGVNRIAGPGR